MSILRSYKGFEVPLTIYHTIPTYRKRSLENIVEKGDKAGNQHFLLFPQCFFFTLSVINCTIRTTLKLSSANAFNLVWSKILSFCKELIGLWQKWITDQNIIEKANWKVMLILFILKHFSKQLFTPPAEKAFENIEEKEENACNYTTVKRVICPSVCQSECLSVCPSE